MTKDKQKEIKKFIYDNIPSKWRGVLLITNKQILTKVPIALVRNAGVKNWFSLSKYIMRKWFLKELERLYNNFEIVHFHKKWKNIELY